MNLMLDGERWRGNGYLPPIWWNPDSGQFEILIDNDGSADGNLAIYTEGPVLAGDTINFDYTIINFDPTIGRSGFLNVYGSSEGVIRSVPISGTTTGTILIDCVEGSSYSIIVTDSSGSSYISNFYDLTIILKGVPDPANQYFVYEMEKGWSFDGNYIPHFLELNWLFQEDPFTYKSINKIRVHGLTKGVVNLQVSLSGMQGDPATDYIQDYMDPQFIDLPFTPIYVSSDFVSATNYTPYSDRGMALQMKFEGRNTARLLPEPAHVLQVLALQGTPSGNGARAQ